MQPTSPTKVYEQPIKPELLAKKIDDVLRNMEAYRDHYKDKSETFISSNTSGMSCKVDIQNNKVIQGIQLNLRAVQNVFSSPEKLAEVPNMDWLKSPICKFVCVFNRISQIPAINDDAAYLHFASKTIDAINQAVIQKSLSPTDVSKMVNSIYDPLTIPHQRVTTGYTSENKPDMF